MSGVAGVQFLLDNNALGAEDTTAPYSVSWNTTTAANGTHTLTARARDITGNTATSAPVTVTVANTGDTAAPTAAITAPTGGATVSGTVTVAATASDNVGVAGVQFLLDNNALGAEDTTVALQRLVEHHDGRQRHPHARRASPRRHRQHRNLGAGDGHRGQCNLLQHRLLCR